MRSQQNKEHQKVVHVKMKLYSLSKIKETSYLFLSVCANFPLTFLVGGKGRGNECYVKGAPCLGKSCHWKSLFPSWTSLHPLGSYNHSPNRTLHYLSSHYSAEQDKQSSAKHFLFLLLKLLQSELPKVKQVRETKFTMRDFMNSDSNFCIIKQDLIFTRTGALRTVNQMLCMVKQDCKEHYFQSTGICWR